MLRRATPTYLVHTQATLGRVEIRRVCNPNVHARLNELGRCLRHVAKVPNTHRPTLPFLRQVDVWEVGVGHIALELLEIPVGGFRFEATVNSRGRTFGSCPISRHRL